MRAILIVVVALLAVHTVSGRLEKVRAQNTDTCIGNITAAVEEVIAAGADIEEAVAECASKNGTARCIARISKVASALALAASDINMAVTACGGRGSACASDLLKAAHDLADAASDVSSAVADCEKKEYFKCVGDVVDLAGYIDKVVVSIKAASSDCK